MKYRLISLLSLSCLVLALIGNATVHAASDWQLKISAPASPLATNSFNIQYTVLAINPANFTVSLYQDGEGPENLVGTQQTNSDPNGINGNSGAFPVTAADGNHSFHLVAVRDDDNDTKTADTSINVNASAPAAPTYLGKTRSGNTYTIKFTAPNDSDVQEVRIYSSTSSTFVANSSSQVGAVHISPGQTTSFSYVANSSAERFHAIRAFDIAGNGSSAVGDTNITVTTTVVNGTAANTPTVGAGGTGANAAAPEATTATGDQNGQILGTSTTTPSGSTKKSTNNQSSKGKVLGVETATKHSSNTWYVILAILVMLALLYWFGFKNQRLRLKNPFSRS